MLFFVKNANKNIGSTMVCRKKKPSPWPVKWPSTDSTGSLDFYYPSGAPRWQLEMHMLFVLNSWTMHFHGYVLLQG